MKLEVAFDGTTLYTENFSGPTALTSAKTFFTDHSLLLGTIAAHSPLQSVSITYDLIYNNGYNDPLTLANVGDGFGFTYALQDPPLSVPETSTWVMMLVGFAGIGSVGHRAWRRRVAVAEQT